MNRFFVATAFTLLAAGCQGNQPPAAESESASPPAAADTAAAPDLGQSGLIPMSASQFAQLNPASGDWAATAVAAPCAVDMLNGSRATEASLVVSRTASLDVTGWILNPQREAPRDFAIILAGENGAYTVRGTSGGDRPDVSRIFKSEAAMQSGFKASADLGTVAPGDYALLLVQETSGQVSRCNTKRTISVTP